MHGAVGWVEYGSAVILGLLLVVSLWRTRAGLKLLDDLRG